MEHLVHIILIGVFFALGLVIWFWQSIRRKTIRPSKNFIVILALLFFILFHASPVHLVMAYDHQSQDSTSSHPCCMPQATDLGPQFIVMMPALGHKTFIQEQPIDPDTPPISPLNNKSPPNFS